MITDLQIDVCKLTLQKMMQGGHFDITAIKQILKITGGVPMSGDLELLSALHCVNFTDFPPRLRTEFPALLQRVLESPSMELEIKFKPQFRMPQLV